MWNYILPFLFFMVWGMDGIFCPVLRDAQDLIQQDGPSIGDSDMLKKVKIIKVIISAIALFSFIHWGLDPEVICKIASDTPQTCTYSGSGLIVNALGTGFSMMLIAILVVILLTWIRKD